MVAPPESTAEPAPSSVDAEAFATLCDLAQGKCGRIPHGLLARHVLAAYPHGDWPVRRAALEALLRRFAGAAAQQLAVARGPVATGAGDFQVGAKGGGTRPWRTRLHSADPPRGSCDCPDFLRGGLGLCKHLLVVLDAVFARTQQPRRSAAAACSAPAIDWNPIPPLDADADWLKRVRFAPERARALRLPAELDGSARQRRGLIEKLRPLAEAEGDPALLRLVRDEEEAAGARRRLETAAATARRALRTLKQPLYPYQVEGVERFLQRGRLLLADDMGLGKTAQALAICHALWRADLAPRGLVVVPASLKPQWQREWHRFTDVPLRCVEGSAEERRALWTSRPRGFLLTNYEQVVRDLDAILEFAPDFAVLDEAQRMKNWQTLTAMSIKALKPPFRLVLTGTPLENRLDELASIMDWVDDRALEPKWRLVPWHTQTIDGGKEILGLRHLDDLRRRLEPVMLRRVRQEILRQLPPRTDTTVPVALSAEQADEHDALRVPIYSLVQKAKHRPLTPPEFLRLMQLLTEQRIIASGLALAHFEETWPALAGRPADAAVLQTLSSPKLQEFREIVSSVAVEQRRKIVVFSQWRRMLVLAQWAVQDLLARAGLRSAFFSGEERPKQRTKNVVEFHDDPGAAVLFLTDAGGVGLNLQHAANCCINLELPWNPALLEQRIGRIYRLGQARPIDVYNLVTAGSIEERIGNLVADKRQLFSGLFDGKSDEVKFERSGSFLEGLRRVVAADAPPALAAVDAGEAETFADAAARATGSSAAPRAEPAPAQAAAAAELLRGLAVRPRPDGGLTIDAPPEAAKVLAGLLRSLAEALDAGARPAT